MKTRHRPLVLALGIALAVASIGAFSMSPEQQLVDRASQGDLSARIELAEFYRREQSEAKALEQLQFAAEAGSPIAQRLLGEHYTRLPDEASFAKGVDFYLQSVSTGDRETRVELGIALAIRAMNPELNRTQRAIYGQHASRMLSSPASEGNPEAAWHLGYLHLTGPGALRSPDVGQDLITKAADAGQPAAAYWVARRHQQIATTGRDLNLGVVVTPASRKAAAEKFIHYLEIAATAGHVGAMDQLANRYRLGDGVAASSEAALFWSAKAAEHRGLMHPVIGPTPTSRAPNSLASGDSSSSNQQQIKPAEPVLQAPEPALAASVVADTRLASEHAIATEAMRARLALAERRIAELEAERDVALASVNALSAELEDLRRHRIANSNATELNRQGLSLYVGRDYEGAERMFRIASESGDVAAFANLGLLYLRGHGVKQSTSKAVKLLRRSSDAGNVIATENLAEIYARGLGVDEDNEHARRWYELALAQGSDSAQHALHQLNDRY